MGIQCVSMPNHHDTYFKYPITLFVNFISVKLKTKTKTKINDLDLLGYVNA